MPSLSPSISDQQQDVGPSSNAMSVPFRRSGSHHGHHHHHLPVISAAQNAASSLTGIREMKHQRSVSDSFYTTNNNADHSEPDDDDEDEGSLEDEERKRARDVKIEPIRSTISTLGKGELTLATLGLDEDEERELHSSGNYERGLINGAADTNATNKNNNIAVRSNITASNSDYGNSGDTNYVGSSNHLEVQDHRMPIRRSVSTSNFANGSRKTSYDRKSMEVSERDRSISVPNHPKESHLQFSQDDDQSHSVPSSARVPGLGSSKGRRSMSSVRESTEGSSARIPKEKRDEKEKESEESKENGRVTGFAYANKKRNREFHRIFRSIESDDYLLDDFSCALSKEILVHGRMYVSERHVCFNSNILGWVTNLVIAFDEIVALEKKSTAGLFPNGIVIQTLHARHSFASFVSRDTVLDFLTAIWKQATPHQPADMRTKQSYSDSEVSMSELEDEEEDDEDEDDDDDDNRLESSVKYRKTDDEDDGLNMSEEDEDNYSISTVSTSSDQNDRESSRGSSSRESGGSSKDEKAGAGNGGGANKWGSLLEGPETHRPTSLPELDSNEKVLLTETVNAPLGVVYNMLYGKDTSWIKRFIVDVEKNTNLSNLSAMQDEGGKLSRKYEYIKPLNSSVGPKQTKCICTETLEKSNLEECIVGLTVVSTPDVPSGNSFQTKTRTGLCWADDNKTKIVISYFIEWSGKSWLKGPIEKGALDGQQTFAKDLIGEINSTLSKAKRKKGPPGKKRKVKRKVSKRQTRERVQIQRAEIQNDWLSTVKNILSMSVLNLPLYTWLCVIFIVLFFTWRRHEQNVSVSEQEHIRLLRLEEEFDMWKWLDSRLPEQRGVSPGKFNEGDILRYPLMNRQAKTHGYGMYSLQDLKEAIRITELRLHLVKEKLGVD